MLNICIKIFVHSAMNVFFFHNDMHDVFGMEICGLTIRDYFIIMEKCSLSACR